MADQPPYPHVPPNIKRLHHECKTNLRILKRKQILKNGFTAAAKRRLLFVPDDEKTIIDIHPIKKPRKVTPPVKTGKLQAGQQNLNGNTSILSSQESVNHPCTIRELPLIGSTAPNRRSCQGFSSQCSNLSVEFDQKMDLNSPFPTSPTLPMPLEYTIDLAVDSPPKIIQGRDTLTTSKDPEYDERQDIQP